MKIFSVLAVFAWSLPATAEPVKAEDQMKDIVIGDANAPNTIIEYFSLTCGHCKAFHTNVLPKLKKNYIDTGKVKFIPRDFPLNNLAVYAHMMARCAPAERYAAYIDALFAGYDRWTTDRDPVGALKQTAKLGGMGEAEFEACLKNEKLFQAMRKSQNDAVKNFEVDSTPTIIVNGKKVDANYEAIEKALKK